MVEIASVKRRGGGRRRQRGAIAILTGLMIAVLVGFLGLAVDLGRLFVIKSEVQTAMDACALAAATQLRPGLTDLTALNNAVALGRLMSDPDRSATDLARPAESVNRANFQDDVIEPASVKVTFSATLGGTYYAADSITPPANARYARCTYPKEKIPVLFMRVLPGGMVTTDVAATAVATMTPAQTTCAIPVALCEGNSNRADDYGLRKGQWAQARTGSSGMYGPGWFGWVNFPESAKPPECEKAGGGANYIKCLMRHGQCDLHTGDPVAEPDAHGKKNSLAPDWNARFGFDPTGSDGPLPDRTGYGYTKFNWGNPGGVAANAAYDGTSLNTPGLPNYRKSFDDYSEYQGDCAAGKEPSPCTKPVNVDTDPPAGSWPSPLKGRSDIRVRRLVVVPVLECSGFDDKNPKTPIIDDWACVLMLAPIGQADDYFKPEVEFLGLASKPGSPCASAGLPGGSIGPLVPGLVQ